MTDLLGLAHRLRWVFAGVAAALACFATVFAVSAMTREPEILGSGPAGSPVTISGDLSSNSGVSVYADARPTGDRYECTVAPHGAVFMSRDYPPRTFKGRTLYELGTTGRKSTEAGQQITCPPQGISDIVVIEDVRAEHVVFAVSLGVGALFLGIWSVFVFAITGSQRRASSPP